MSLGEDVMDVGYRPAAIMRCPNCDAVLPEWIEADYEDDTSLYDEECPACGVPLEEAEQ